jgi:hypothetical protein
VAPAPPPPEGTVSPPAQPKDTAPPPAQPKDVVPPPDQTEQPSPPPTPKDAPTGDGAEHAARQTVVNHWSALKRRDYAEAWSYFTSPFTDQNSRSTWIDSHKSDGTDSIDVKVGPADISGDTGSVRLEYARTHSARAGRQCFTGSYDVRKVGGTWLIADSRVQVGC